MEDIVHFAHLFIRELDDYVPHLTRVSSTLNVRWSPPTKDLMKANFDTSYNGDDYSSVFGIIIRNSGGLIMAAGTYPNSHVANSDLAEAIACDQTLILLKDLGFDREIVEGNSLIVISKLCSSFIDRSVLSVALGNILRRTNHFSLLKFMHVKREGNKAACLLVRAGRTYSEPKIWIEEAPPKVELAASQDRWWVDKPV
ncbi:hypothetical protein V6N13_140589 [Hibiscus sabdariffa]|uniref:Uncharacterized protein n=2 Tax=Hibiscus sabdariffa TaxID=183260 RepID=A0ABR2BLH0_9ROSI